MTRKPATGSGESHCSTIKRKEYPVLAIDIPRSTLEPSIQFPGVLDALPETTHVPQVNGSILAAAHLQIGKLGSQGEQTGGRATEPYAAELGQKSLETRFYLGVARVTS